MDAVNAAVLANLSLASIRLSATNPRKSYDAAAMRELEDSIRGCGVTVPVLVRPLFDQPGGVATWYRSRRSSATDVYELVAGSRRLRACQSLGLETIPAIVREMTDDEVLDAQIVENLQRADVHPVEEAEAYRALMEHAELWGEPGAKTLTAEDVARRVGKTTAYVAQRLRLLSLEVLAKRLFAESHITLGQALLLARLTLADQVRAMVFLLGIAAWEIKRDSPAEGLIERRITDWEAAQTSERRQQFAGARLVRPTEAELKRWIADHVLLLLKSAPWRLDDAALVPVAGPCTTCPKRAGSNAALFADLTPEDDVCSDQICFAAKRKAFVTYTTDAAKVSGGLLLRLSSKRSHEKLPELVTEKTLLKQGQWVEAEAGSCGATAPGMLRDGEDAGKLLSVCPRQSCKVHKHEVDKPRAVSSATGGKQESSEDREKREESVRAALLAVELPIRRAVYQAVLGEHRGGKFLESFLAVSVRRPAAVCDEMGIVFLEPDDAWMRDGAAQEALNAYLGTATLDQLHLVAFHALHTGELVPNAWRLQRDLADDRDKLFRSARHVGLDPDAIAAEVTAELAGETPAAPAKAVTAKKAAPKKIPAKAAPAKKAAPKKIPAKKVAAKKTLSAKSRKAIADAIKKRWSDSRAKAATKTAKRAVR